MIGTPTRRAILVSAGVTAALPTLTVLAQDATRTYRVGLLGAGQPITNENPLAKALIGGLAKAGFALGKNLAIERRAAEGHLERLPQLVSELAASHVDAIATTGFPAALAAKLQGNIPVVAINAGDPVGTGLVESLAHPGGNLTGISDVSAEVTPKRLELLKEFSPNLRKVAVLWNADDLGMTLRYRASESVGKQFGIMVQPLGVREPDDFALAFRAMDADMPDGILMVTDSLTILNRKRVFDYAAAHKLPAIYEFDFLVRDGGLMSYGPDPDESNDKLAALLVRILKGASPADLPIERPTQFRFVINTKTAKSIGFDIPQSLLARADEVIE
jgi:putative ABC transport system substrate-binding protein